jgi:hypothetical protein
MIIYVFKIEINIFKYFKEYIHIIFEQNKSTFNKVYYELFINKISAS